MVKIMKIGSFIFGILMIAGCSSTITQLSEVEVSGPPHKHSIRITENRKPADLEVRTYASFSKDKIYTSQLEGDYQGQVQVPMTTSDNFFFKPGNFQGGIDFDFAFSSHFALTGGLNFANIKGDSYSGRNIGIGFFAENNSAAWRFDFNLKYQKMQYDAKFLIIEDPGGTDPPMEYNQIEKLEYWNTAYMFTFNTKRSDYFLNYFFNVCLGNQTFYEFDLQNVQIVNLLDNSDYDYTESYLSLGLGVYKNIMENGRLIFGIRFTKYNDKNDNIIIPDAFIQYDFKLF